MKKNPEKVSRNAFIVAWDEAQKVLQKGDAASAKAALRTVEKYVKNRRGEVRRKSAELRKRGVKLPKLPS